MREKQEGNKKEWVDISLELALSGGEANQAPKK
jgi:hypothetical protein